MAPRPLFKRVLPHLQHMVPCKTVYCSHLLGSNTNLMSYLILRSVQVQRPTSRASTPPKTPISTLYWATVYGLKNGPPLLSSNEGWCAAKSGLAWPLRSPPIIILSSISIPLSLVEKSRHRASKSLPQVTRIAREEPGSGQQLPLAGHHLWPYSANVYPGNSVIKAGHELSGDRPKGTLQGVKSISFTTVLTCL